MGSGKGDAEKARYWQRTVGEAAQSAISIRAFCRHRPLKEGRFYWWQRRLKAGRPERVGSPGGHPDAASSRRMSPYYS